jgi:hypothetical protein
MMLCRHAPSHALLPPTPQAICFGKTADSPNWYKIVRKLIFASVGSTCASLVGRALTLHPKSNQYFAPK